MWSGFSTVDVFGAGVGGRGWNFVAGIPIVEINFPVTSALLLASLIKTAAMLCRVAASPNTVHVGCEYVQRGQASRHDSCCVL
jgi:hypothetical protein